MKFVDNDTINNSVLDLMFINSQNPAFNNYHILQDKRLPSDHTLLYVKIQISKSNINEVKRNIKVESKKEIKFNTFIVSKVSSLNSEGLTSQNRIEDFTNSISQVFAEA